MICLSFAEPATYEINNIISLKAFKSILSGFMEESWNIYDGALILILLLLLLLLLLVGLG